MKDYRIEFYQEYLGERMITEGDTTYHMDPISTEMFIWVSAKSAQEAVDIAFDNSKERVHIFAMQKFNKHSRVVKTYSNTEVNSFDNDKLMTSEELKQLL